MNRELQAWNFHVCNAEKDFLPATSLKSFIVMRGSISSAVRRVGTNGPPLVFRLEELKAFSKTLPERTHPLFLLIHESRRYSLSVRSSDFQLGSELASESDSPSDLP